MWKLIIETDTGERTVLPLRRESYAIGRAAENQVRLTEQNVSRRHATLAKRGPAYMVRDLDSYNGLFVNGSRVRGLLEIGSGDLIQVGDYRLVLEHEATVPTDPGRGLLLLGRPSRLVVIVGPTPFAEFPLGQTPLTIGRAPEADIVIDHDSISRVHCELVAADAGRYEIFDKSSANGVFVNRVAIRRGFVEPGDRIELGEVELKFLAAGEIFRMDTTPSEWRDPRARAPLRMSKGVPYVVFVLVVAVGAAVAWLLLRP